MTNQEMKQFDEMQLECPFCGSGKHEANIESTFNGGSESTGDILVCTCVMCCAEWEEPIPDFGPIIL